MNKQEKELTWKHFWKQKWEEALPFVVLFGIMGIIGLFVYLGINAEKWNWQGVSIVILLIIIVLALLFGLGWEIRSWLKSNWKKANAHAKEELKKARKKK